MVQLGRHSPDANQVQKASATERVSSPPSSPNGKNVPSSPPPDAASPPEALPAGLAELAPLHFEIATVDDVAFLSTIPEAKDLLTENYKVAHSNLCNGGLEDTIILSDASAFCGSGGCEALVVEKNDTGHSVLLNQNLPDNLAISNSIMDGCHALAAIDDKGEIIVGEMQGTPLFGKQLIYPLRNPSGVSH